MGRPVVEFDGDDWLSTVTLWNETNHGKYPYNRWGWRDHGYSAFAVSRYTGGKNGRVFTSSDGVNWLMGHWSNRLGTYYFNGGSIKGSRRILIFIYLNCHIRLTRKVLTQLPVSGMMVLAGLTTRETPRAPTAGLVLLAPLPWGHGTMAEKHLTVR